MISILFSSHNREDLLRRGLHHIEKYAPHYPFEVVLADDGSTDDIEALLRKYSFRSKFIKCDKRSFEKGTGIKVFGNNPAWTNNVAFRHCNGGLIFLQGNDIVAVGDAYNQMLDAMPLDDTYIMFSKTYGLDYHTQDRLDTYDDNITDEVIFNASRNVMQDASRRGGVTNYLSLTTRRVFQDVWYDERMVAGQACEDSDFVRRAARLPDFQNIYCEAITLHQWHGVSTHQIKDGSRLHEGLLRNRALMNKWDGNVRTQQGWPPGEFVSDVIEINASRNW